ncbi:hypothetical protein JCM10908_004318 [Rhodotorula pacifica]|uniref:uncharacterized protein n=1 Tax=Rhodotorula pacifica TaxID=1495444 RepID=UPI0031702720
MSGDRVGYHWPALAQQAFMAGTCGAGQSISEWCALSAADQCCGALCPNAPITGPGTVIVFTVGTLMNVLVALLWKSEAPYNLLLQLLSTDGAFVGLLFRLLLNENRLTEFHAAFVPLAIMSCLPVAVAACTVEIEFMHNLDYNSYISLWGEYVEEIILMVFGAHLIAWAFLFIMSLSVGTKDAFQLNCSNDLPVAYWSRVVGIVAIACWVAMLLLWFVLLVSMKKWRTKSGFAYRRDVLQIIAKFTMVSALMKAVKPVKEGWSRSREIVRWSFTFVIYFAWVSAYIALYILALQKFVMVGDNPFDYGQVAACLGVLGGAITVLRCIVNEPAYYRARDDTTHSNSFLNKVRYSILMNKSFTGYEMRQALTDESNEDNISPTDLEAPPLADHAGHRIGRRPRLGVSRSGKATQSSNLAGQSSAFARSNRYRPRERFRTGATFGFSSIRA